MAPLVCHTDATNMQKETSYSSEESRAHNMKISKAITGNITNKKMQRITSYLRYVLLFGAPLLFLVILILVLVAVYVIRPYAGTKSFTQTTCQVTRAEINSAVVASCSAGTDPFQPCVKVYVSYATGESIKEGIIMENEQALMNCNQCSYTFGRHNLFHSQEMECDGWKENFDPQICVETFLERYGQQNETYSCFFNPENHSQIVRNLHLDLNTVIQSFAWPSLICIFYALTYAFVSYSDKQTELSNKAMLREIKNNEKLKNRSFAQNNEWKKKKLSQCLGIRNLGDTKHRGSIAAANFKRFSVSLQSLDDIISHNENDQYPTDLPTIEDEETDLAEDDFFDMRHLDLAVSKQNIDDLTTTYAYFTSQRYALAQGLYNHNKLGGNMYSTLPATLCAERRQNGSHKASPGHPVDNALNGAMNSPPASMETVSITTSTMISEQDIDLLYKVHSLVSPSSKKSESTV